MEDNFIEFVADYKNVTAGNLADLNKKVLKELDNEFEPIGGVVIDPNPSSPDQKFIQTMIQMDEEEVK